MIRMSLAWFSKEPVRSEPRMSEQANEERPVIRIEYLRPEELPTFDASGARIIRTPYHTILEFYIDEPVDPIRGEVIYEKDGQKRSEAERAYSGPQQIVRRILVRLRVPPKTFEEFANAFARIAKEQVEGSTQ